MPSWRGAAALSLAATADAMLLLFAARRALICLIDAAVSTPNITPPSTPPRGLCLFSEVQRDICACRDMIARDERYDADSIAVYCLRFASCYDTLIRYCRREV